eukprot:comp12362_c1_seq1/m.7243 comp12362_c1_seq1/g.7243  ORF comp12362_c1_seq1/g.7243 comp12362_c1_seq1/m.7243 type:complete len:507 (-) comp12362_c1_seq1:255-1775(-)
MESIEHSTRQHRTCGSCQTEKEEDAFPDQSRATCEVCLDKQKARASSSWQALTEATFYSLQEYRSQENNVAEREQKYQPSPQRNYQPYMSRTHLEQPPHYPPPRPNPGSYAKPCVLPSSEGWAEGWAYAHPSTTGPPYGYYPPHASPYPGPVPLAWQAAYMDGTQTPVDSGYATPVHTEMESKLQQQQAAAAMALVAAKHSMGPPQQNITTTHAPIWRPMALGTECPVDSTPRQVALTQPASAPALMNPESQCSVSSESACQPPTHRMRTSSMSTTISQNAAREPCVNCKTLNSPLWRRDPAGNCLCNACGLFFKSHGHHRPLRRVQGAYVRANSAVSETPLECANCKTTTTTLWRRNGQSGEMVCNACGLYWKLHKKARPVNMTSHTIKKRNRKAKSLSSIALAASGVKATAPTTAKSNTAHPNIKSQAGPYCYPPRPMKIDGYGYPGGPHDGTSAECGGIKTEILETSLDEPRMCGLQAGGEMMGSMGPGFAQAGGERAADIRA